MKTSWNASLSARLQWCTRGASLLVILLGGVGLAGWALPMATRQSFLTGLPFMVPNTAGGLILVGLALWMLRSPVAPDATRRVAQAIALIVAVLGLVTVGEYLFVWDAGIDQVVFSESVSKVQDVLPGRPAILAAVNFSLYGLSLLALDTRSRAGHKPAELLSLTAMLISLLGLIGYVCNVPLFYGWRSLFPNSGMALSTVTAFLALGAGVLCARPAGGLMEIVTSRTASGFMARRLLLAPVFIPLVMGWMKLLAQGNGLYNAEFANWLLAFGNIFVFTLAIWWCARLIYRAEAVRQRAEEDLHQLNAKLEHRISERTEELSQTMAALRGGEERVRLVLDAALDAVITADDQGRITSWNREAQKIFGWSGGEMVGQSLSATIIPPRHRQAHERGMEHFRATQEGPIVNKRIEITAIGRDGREFPVELAITPIRLGEKFIFSAFVRDITERKEGLEEIRQLNAELEQRVQQRTAQLEASVSELEAFSYSVSHDLRAPLRHVAGFVELLREELQPVLAETSQHHLEVISDSAQQMGVLIDNLLAFSRMGRAQIRYAQMNTDELVKEAVRELEPETNGRAIAWNIAALPEVFGDRALLKQVWLNLLANAIKYTRHQERAEISIDSVPGNGEVEFRVRDNGAGFDMKYADKLFGVFQRLHLAEEFEGTGIGLANVRRIVARHGGKTWAEGRVDAGATFHFTLPIALQPVLQP